MQALDAVIELSDLYEAVGVEGGLFATAIDKEVIPSLHHLIEGEEFGLGDRFVKVIDKVRASANQTGKDKIRTLKDMMKSSLSSYVQKTQDAMTAREIFHRAIMSGSDTMLAVTAAAILANVIHAQHAEESKSLIQKVASRLTGKQSPAHVAPAMENASGAASGTGAIATSTKKKKRDSIFVETLRFADLIGNPEHLDVLREIVDTGVSQKYDGVIVDSTTAELVLSVHRSIPMNNRRNFENKSLAEMIQISHRCVQRGIIQVVMEEG